MDRVRDRIGDKRVLGLVKAFLKSGILTEDGQMIGTKTGTPQGGILSPLLANIALSVLDDHFAEAWETRWQPKPIGTTPPPRRSQLPACVGMRTTSWCWCREPRRTPRG